MKGVLPVGVEFAGKVHREFELRPQFVSDSCAVYEDKANASRAEKNPYFAGVCIIARRLEKLGDIPRASITPDLLLTMRAEDMTALQLADRGAPRPGPDSAGDAPTDPGADENRV